MLNLWSIHVRCNENISSGIFDQKILLIIGLVDRLTIVHQTEIAKRNNAKRKYKEIGNLENI